MGTLTINDCGTAHETQLLDIYNGLIDAERDRLNKEPTLLEKSNIELQVAEAYQSILKICNDGGQIAKALDILKERAKNVSINELSNIAVDVAVDVFASPTVDGNDIKDVAAFGVAQAITNGFRDNTINDQIDSRVTTLNPEDIPIPVDDIGSVVAAYRGDDGRTYVLVDPEDSRFGFANDNDKENEKEIAKRYSYISSLCCDVERFPEKANENLALITKNIEGLGIDAMLRYLREKVFSTNGNKFFDKDDSFYRELLKRTLDATKKDKSFAADNYTTVEQLAIFCEIMRNPMMRDGDQKVIKELTEMMEKANPKVYALAKKDPDLYSKLEAISELKSMENKTNDNDKKDMIIGPETVAIDIAGNTNPISPNETIEKIEDIMVNIDSQKIDDYMIQKKEAEERKARAQEKTQNFLVNRRVTWKNMGVEDTIGRKRAAIINSMRKNGVGIAVSSFFSEGSLKTDNGEIPMIMSQLLDFENNDENNEFINMITSEDIRIMKERLEKLLENQDDKKKEYICTLGKIVSNAVEKDKILSADAAVSKLIEEVGEENPIFTEPEGVDEER